MSLEQMSYECPGLHGPGTQQDIFIQTFAQVLERYPKLIIPLFQRRYCWTDKQFEKWWNDVHHGKRNHLGLHSTGNVVVKPNQNQEPIIIDGQQRLTTTLILLISLRNRMKNHNEANKYIMNGEKYRLIPSYLDRPAFYSMIDNTENKSDSTSHQWKAYNYFDNKNQHLSAEEIEKMFHNAIHKMSIMLVIVMNNVNLGQIYLWLQEKSIFGEGALVHNASPGEFLAGGDMVRNLVLTAVANQELQSQEEFYFQHWLKPIEEKVTTTLTEFVYQFVQKFDFKHESKTEIVATQYLKDKPHARTNILAYARFYSFYEWRLKTANNTMGLSNGDPELVIQVTKEILKEMADDLISPTDPNDSFVFKKPINPQK